MIETAARAEQLHTSGFPGPYFTWEVPGKPVSVAIPLALMDLLEQETVQSFRSLSSLGSEIGGVLFGTAAPGKTTLVTISSYEQVTCDYSLGPLYHLSENDLGQLDRAISRAKASGMVPVGFFRSHTRKGLGLDGDDKRLLDLKFPESYSIALLIRPYAAKASTAGIFIRENGEVRSETSYLEFPFRSSHCTATPRPAAPAGVRAQIVPIASRREPMLADLPLMAPPAPAPAPELAPPAVAVEPVTVTAAVPVPAAPPVPVAISAPAVVAPVEVPEPVAEKPAPAENRSKKLYIYAAAAVLAIAGIGGAAYFGGFHRSGKAIPTQDGGLSLRVERSAGELLLTWNRDSAAIRTATRAVLEISDGTQHENVEMDLAQLRNGTIVYSPVTADVVFKMDITGPDQKQLASESVRVLRTRPSPLAPDTPQQTAPPATQAAATTTPAATPPVEPAVEEETKPAGPPRVTKAFNTESLAQRLRPATQTDMLDAPAAGTQSASLSPLPAGLGASPAVAPAPPPPTPTVAPDKPALGGQVETARLVSRKDPEYSKMARDAGAKGVVKLVATVGPDGRVISVKPVSGHPLLIRPATEAVLQWVYRPTYLNGVAIETHTDITLNFVNDR